MKILIEDAIVLTFRRDKPVIDRGYVYINKGVIASVGEGSPPPEYEFAEYIIDGKDRVVMPGFAVGIASLEESMLVYVSKCRKNTRDCIELLSKDELKALIETVLTLLAYRGATSVVVYVGDVDFAGLVAKAVSEAWIRTRLVFRSVDALRDGVRAATRNVVDQEAIPRGILSFGISANEKIPISVDELRTLDAYAYVDRCASVPKEEAERVICINSSVAARHKVVVDSVEMWKGEEGIGFSDPTLLNPQRVLQELRYQGFRAEDIIRILSNLNPYGFNIGNYEIVEGAPADLIIANFREPPYGPMLFDHGGLYELLSAGLFAVETAIISGEPVIDRFEPLMIGRKVFSVVAKIREELLGRK